MTRQEDIRQKDILEMKFVMLDVMKDYWKKSYKEVTELFDKYRLFEYIDIAYDYFNTMGEMGIIEEFEDFIKLQESNKRD